LKHGMAILGAAGEFAEAFVFPACEVASNTNPDYDCTGDGKKECADWDYWGLGCSGDKDRGGPCEYNYKFGDVLLDHSCRCRDASDPPPAPCLEYNYDYPGNDLHYFTPWTHSSVEACQQECQEHSDCKFFSYNFVNPIWNCFLKSSKAERIPSDSHTSASKACLLYSSAPPPRFYLQHANTGLYVHPDGGYVDADNTDLVFFEGGAGSADDWRLEFEEIDAGNGRFYLKHAITGKCVHPRGGEVDANDIQLVFHDGCDGSSIQFEKEDAGDGRFLLKHADSGKCVHPKGGRAKKDVTLVFYDGCDPSKVKLVYQEVPVPDAAV